MEKVKSLRTDDGRRALTISSLEPSAQVRKTPEVPQSSNARLHEWQNGTGRG